MSCGAGMLLSSPYECGSHQQKCMHRDSTVNSCILETPWLLAIACKSAHAYECRPASRQKYAVDDSIGAPWQNWPLSALFCSPMLACKDAATPLPRSLPPSLHAHRAQRHTSLRPSLPPSLPPCMLAMLYCTKHNNSQAILASECNVLLAPMNADCSHKHACIATMLTDDLILEAP